MKTLLLAVSILAQVQAMAAAVTIGTEVLLTAPPEISWQQALNTLPIDGSTVTLNPPQFQWSYSVDYQSLNTDINPKTFVFQIATDPNFIGLVANKRTLWNFYNTLSPLTAGSTYYWRVGYLQTTNNTATGDTLAPSIISPDLTSSVSAWSQTYSFTVSNSATAWDRSYMADNSYLSGKATHPYMMLTSSTRAALKTWLDTCETAYNSGSTNRIEYDIGNSWRLLKINAATATNDAAWTGGGWPAGMGHGDWAYYVQQVAFMWGVTRQSQWTNQLATKFDMLAAEYRTNAVGNFMTDFISSSIAVNLNQTLSFGYDWCYDILSASQRTNVVNALGQRSRFALMGLDVFWDALPPYSFGVGDPTGVYSTGVRDFRGSLFNYGTSHGNDNAYMSVLGALAGYNENAWCRQYLDIMANYLTGPTYCYRREMGNGRGYTSVHWGTDRLMYTLSLLQSVFPEMNWGSKNPFVSEAADWLDRVEPVGYQAGSEAWGDTGWGDLETWQSGLGGRHLAYLTQDPKYVYHWIAQENVWIGKNHSPGIDSAATIALPYSIGYSVTPATNSVLAKIFPISGWMFSSSHSPSLARNWTNAVGLVFQARPSGAEMGHTYLSDGSFQLWAYGAPITDAGGQNEFGDQARYAHLPNAHYSLMIDGRGVSYPETHQSKGYYSRFVAYTNNSTFTYCAADLTRAYPTSPLGVDSTGWLIDGSSYGAFYSTNSLTGMTNVVRELLFMRKKYLVVHDTLEGTSNRTYSWIYQVREPGISLNTNGVTFNYPSTNWDNGATVNTYVAHIGNPANLIVYNQTGSTAGSNYRNNPITGENWWTNSVQGGVGDLHPRNNTIWVCNGTPTKSFKFLSVVYPVAPGGSAPTITRIDDDTVRVVSGAETDVISFNPSTAVANGATLIVDLTFSGNSGGGDSGSGSGSPPTISSIVNQIILTNTATSALPFTIGSATEPVDDLDVTVSSSNHTLADDADCVLGGSGSNRTVTVTPNADQSGVTTIRLVVTDNTLSLSTTNTFQLTVQVPPTPVPGVKHVPKGRRK